MCWPWDVGDAKPGAFSPGGPRPDVVWEDDDILIINKPAGMAVHGRSERGEPTVGSMVSAYLSTNTPFHPVNRLDPRHNRADVRGQERIHA